MRDKTPIVTPRILILEGLWSDTGEAIEAAGGDVEEITPWEYEAVERALLSKEYDAMILTGGADINPALYGEDIDGAVGIDKLRDATELMALRHARAQRLPVLGICRGSQIMTAFMGGKLVQHIDGHVSTKHWVNCTPEGRTFRRACNSREIAVVSLHHQMVRRPGPEMRIAARAHDGTTEAVESKDGLMLGVQFHPELNAFSNPQSYSIFRWLVESAARRAGGRAPRRRFRMAQRRTMDYTGGYYDTPAASTSTRIAGYLESGATGSGAGTTSSPPRKPRKAGDPAIPSMRPSDAESDGPTLSEMVTLIESSTGATPVLLDRDGRRLSTSVECDGSCQYGICGCEDAREYTTPTVIESTALPVCPDCGLVFDDERDLYDHIDLGICGGTSTVADCTDCTAALERFKRDPSPFYEHASIIDRYPELEPPPGHPAWDDVAAAERSMGL